MQTAVIVTKHLWLVSLSLVATCLATFFLTTQVSQTVTVTQIYDWQFTNENGNTGSSTDLIQGEVIFEFDDSQTSPQKINISSFKITNITNLNSSSIPYFGDGEIELNTNLVNVGFGNIFAAEFDSNGGLQSLFINFSETEEFFYLSFASSLIPSEVSLEDWSDGSLYKDSDASSFQIYERVSSVPWSFSLFIDFLTNQKSF